MPALPPEDNLDGDAAGFNQGVFKQALRDLRGFLAGLLGTTGVPDAALAALKMLDPKSVLNLKPTFAVAASALTVTFKDSAGNDLSAANPGFVSQRAAAAGDGGFTLRKLTANVALTISSGSTLGHASGVAGVLFWYLLDNAGAQEVAVCGTYQGKGGIYSTTAEGGLGGADSATVMYSANARANLPGRLVAVTLDTQAVAGTWAALPSSVYQGQWDLTTEQLEDRALVRLASGTRMLFQQTSAPTGWTKETSATYNDVALRITTGTVGTGGADAFTTTFGTPKSTANYTLTTADIPSHTHGQENASAVGGGVKHEFAALAIDRNAQAGTNVITGGTGGGGAHAHTLNNFNIKYADVIIASKD